MLLIAIFSVLQFFRVAVSLNFTKTIFPLKGSCFSLFNDFFVFLTMKLFKLPMNRVNFGRCNFVRVVHNSDLNLIFYIFKLKKLFD